MNKKTFRFMFLLGIFIIVSFIMMQNFIVFEDGSFGFGKYPYLFSGCFPWGICQ